MSGKQNDNNDDDFENLISRVLDLQFRYKSITNTNQYSIYIGITALRLCIARKWSFELCSLEMRQL